MATSPASKTLVLGCGAVGLRTAIELVFHRNVSVVLRAPNPPVSSSNTSQGAGGLWMPFHCDDPRVSTWAQQTLDELHPIAIDEKSPLVERVPAVYLLADHGGPKVADFVERPKEDPLPSWTKDPRLDFQHMTTEMLHWQNEVHRLRIPPLQDKYPHAWLFVPPIVDTARMLQHWMDRLVQSSKVDIDVQTNHLYTSLDEVVAEARHFGCDSIVNATGLGARELCGDDQLVPARGVLHHYDRKSIVRRSVVSENSVIEPNQDAVLMTEDAPWGSDSHPCYLIPRGDKLVVGGTYLEHDTEPTIRPSEHEQLIQNAHRLGIDTEQSQPVGDGWVGFRPYRQGGCRVELESESDVPICHAYGFGGSGWTLNVGVAQEVADLLTQPAASSRVN